MRRVVQAAQGVVVDDRAGDAAVVGQHACLRLDLLGGEDAADRREQRVAVEQLEVAGQLLDAVDLAAPLDLDRDRARRRRRGTSGPPGRSRWGTPGGPGSGPSASVAGCSASSSWRCFSTPSFCRPGSTPRSWLESWWTSSMQDPQGVVGPCAGDGPLDLAVVGVPSRSVHGGRHPVQRLVGAAVGVHEHRPVGLDHQHPGRHRQVGGQPSGVVDLAAGDDEPHGGRIYRGRTPVRAGRPVATSTRWVSTMPSEAPLAVVVVGHDVERAAVVAAEHAREAAAVGLDGVEHLAALGDAGAALPGDAGVPDRPFGVGADAVGGRARSEVGPDPSVDQRRRRR